MSLRMLLASTANRSPLELNIAHWPAFTHSAPFHDSPARHRFVAVQELSFQYSFGWQLYAVVSGAGVVTQFPFFPAECPGGHCTHEPFGQILRRKSASPGFGSGSLHEPLGQMRRRRSAVGFLLSFSSFGSGVSPMLGAATIRPSLPDSFSRGITRPRSESGERAGDADLPALESENDEPKAWLPEEPGVGATWLSGILAGLGVLLCDMVGLAE